MESRPPNALRLLDLIRKQGHLAYWAPSEGGAAQLIRELSFSLVFWDLDMDGDLGPSLIRQWKEQNGAWLLAAMTAKNTREKEACARSQGIIRYLHKPVPQEDVVQILDFAQSRLGGKNRKEISKGKKGPSNEMDIPVSP
jgi:DNA-binding response OmpR family regulator